MEQPPAERSDQENQPTLYQEALAEQAASQETAPDTPRIYLRDTGAWAKNVERGRWVDATDDIDDLLAARDELVNMSPFPQPEVVIFWAANFEGLQIDEHEDLATVHRLAHGILAHGRPFAAYVEHFGRDDETLDAFADLYMGSWPNIAEWAKTMVEDLWWDQLARAAHHRLLPHIRIDYHALGQELSYDAYVIEDPEREQVHVFWPHA